MKTLAKIELLAPERVMATLDSICMSDAFRKSKRMRELLRYLVNESLERPGRPVTAEAIAADVFKRVNGFDPIDDPIVRTTVSRLRSALAAHYEREDCDDEVEIKIPRGDYLPEFRLRMTKATPRNRWESLRSKLWMLNAASTVAAILALGVALTVGATTCKL